MQIVFLFIMFPLLTASTADSDVVHGLELVTLTGKAV
jgi:hypothetical protein